MTSTPQKPRFRPHQECLRAQASQEQFAKLWAREYEDTYAAISSVSAVPVVSGPRQGHRVDRFPLKRWPSGDCDVHCVRFLEKSWTKLRGSSGTKAPSARRHLWSSTWGTSRLHSVRRHTIRNCFAMPFILEGSNQFVVQMMI